VRGRARYREVRGELQVHRGDRAYLDIHDLTNYVGIRPRHPEEASKPQAASDQLRWLRHGRSQERCITTRRQLVYYGYVEGTIIGRFRPYLLLIRRGSLLIYIDGYEPIVYVIFIGKR
jgi:hypothetical protein